LQLTDKTFIGTSGMDADFKALGKILDVQLSSYEYKMGRQAST
jgi:20S proteasome alpha/beta subunit